MELNTLENSFFEKVLRVKLDVPVNATVVFEDESIEMIVIPQINEDGRLVFKYTNASPYRPKHKGGVLTGTGMAAFDRHPSLERAWLREDVVNVTLRRSVPVLTHQIESSIAAKVLNAGIDHTGLLRLDRNQVTVKEGWLSKTHFSLTNVPDFMDNRPCPDFAKIDKVREFAKSQLPSGWGVGIYEPSVCVGLGSEDGWSITITKENLETRGSKAHNGVITKEDGNEYSVDELIDVLSVLESFFTFVVGDYCLPTVAIGYGVGGSPLWGQIGRFTSNPPKSFNWFANPQNMTLGSHLEVLFPKFWQTWIGKGKEVSEAIDLYVRSARLRRDGYLVGAITDSYAGLETLASLVLGQTIVGASAGKIDQALKSKGIPHRCLKSLNLPVFENVCKTLNVSSGKGVFVLSEVRNYDPHPLGKGADAQIKPDLYELIHNNLSLLVYLHDLSQFYFEYLFLAYCVGNDTKAEPGHGRFRRLLAELNS